ncbi:MAG: hypothetical protein ACTHMC_10265 [Pseudobacter sp.]|uniref:hypothetical protein n=1 Tax=Pseudobacter sp. TaxID=2045420 RepID=UPI003F7D226A
MRRINLLLCIITLVVANNNLMAQDDRTSFDKSRKISDQLKNGTAPGMRFAPVTHKKVKREEPDRAKISTRFSEQLKNGTLEGNNVARGGGGTKSRTINTNARRSNAGSSKLPSDQQSSKTPETTPAVDVKQPSQGGVAQPDLKVVVPKSTKKDPTPAPAAGNAPDAGKLKRN